MNFSTTCILFLSALTATQARLGSDERRLALRNAGVECPPAVATPPTTTPEEGSGIVVPQPPQGPSESVCAEGYTCWEDKSGSLWAKKDSVASGMDCDSVCFSAYAGSSTFHTCKRGVTAPKDGGDLAEVIFGQQNFNCEGTTGCWGNQSPDSLSGTILITGNEDNFAKNCYFPSAETLSCDVPIDSANCFGERFASVCPCTQEEEHAITTAQKWRLYTHSEYDKGGRPAWSWNLNNIYFYSSSDCSGSPLDLPVEPAKFSDSGNGGSFWTPERAFGDNSGTWGGRYDSTRDGNLWVAVEFPTNVDVGCVQFDQAANYAKYVKLQAVPAGSTIWHTVEFVSNGQAGTNKIQVV